MPSEPSQSYEHLGKFSTVQDANKFAESLSVQQAAQYNPKQGPEEYIKLLRQQQLQVLSKRFNDVLIKSSIYPIPTSASPYLYPYMELGLIEAGNINLYSRPRKLVNGEIKTLHCLVIHDYGISTASYFGVTGVPEISVNSGGSFSLIIPRVGVFGGQPVEWTEAEALQNYLNTGQFLAKCSTQIGAATYAKLLEEQAYVVLDSRFPDRNFTEGV